MKRLTTWRLLNYSNQALKVNSFNARTLLLKSKALIGLQDTVRSEYFLRKALENDEPNIESYLLAIQIFMARSEYDTVSALLKEALALQPDHPQVILQVGTWLRSDGLLDSAERIWRKLNGDLEHQISSWRLLADSKFNRGQYDSAQYYSDLILSRKSR